MSKTVDERVVEMRFDNKNFEQNVSTTMSTLDKLKQKLNFKGASSGLENISSAAKKVDMNGLANGVETVRAKFSALDVMGVTALANITNQAINAGKRIASALTIDPVKTGLSEYETKMNAIQVIKANTRGKNTMEDITAALDDLNDYADKTIYNFAQMTSNIGKFTAQGLDVNQAKEAVKGMANLAAASGASAEDMARATYQMSQALGGTIKMIDWNSLRNANMATTELKNTLIDVAKVHGVAIDEMIAKEGTFEQTLSSGWLSGEMFTEAMNIYSGVYSDAELKAKGFTDSQIANFKELAAMAESAATEVKTFTQLWDVLKETAQSGWTQTWELIFGGFEEAKSMFTNLQNYFGDIINGWSDARNTLLSGALKPLETWNKIKDKLSDSGLGKIREVAETVGDVTDKLEYFQKIVDKVWRGDYNNSDTGRFELLENAGYDHRVVQDLVNKGYGYKLTIEDIEASHKKFGLTLDKTSGSTKKASAEFSSLSDEQLKNAGLTDAEVRLYRDLEKEARRTGKTIQEVVDEMSKQDGRAMLIESVKNAWKGFLTIITSVKNAFADIFPPMTVVQLYRIIEAINKFSQKLVVSEDTAKKLTRTFKGLFAVIDIVTTVFGGGFKLAFKILTQILSAFDMDVLDLTANIGDAIVKFRDWIDSTLDFTKAFEVLSPYVSDFVGWLKRMIKHLKEMKIISKIVSSVKKFWSALKKIVKIDLGSIDFTAIFTKIKDSFGSAIPEEMREFGRNIIEGIQNGLWDKITDVWNTMVSICKRIAEAVTEFFGIHSPATKGIDWGISIIMGITVGIINGVKFCIKYIIEAIRELGSKIGDYFEEYFEKIVDKLFDVFPKIIAALKNFDWSKLLYIIPLGVVIYVVKQLHDLVIAFTDGIGSINEVIDGFADIERSVSKKIKADAFNTMADGLKKIATSIAVLVGSIYVLSKIPADQLYTSVAIIFALAITLTIMATAMRKLQAASATIGKDGLKIAGLKTGLLTIGAAMLLLANTVKLVGTMKPEEAKQGFLGLAAICGALLIFVGALRLLVMGKSAIRVSVVAKSLTSIAIAMMLMVGVCKLASKLSLDELKQAGIFAGAFLVFVGILVKVTTIGSKKKIAEVSGLLKSIAGSMLLMVLVCKLAGKLEASEMLAGAGFMVAFLVFIKFLVGIVQMSPRRKIAELSKILLSISASMLLMTLVCKLAGKLEISDMLAGAGFMAAFLGFVWALTKITTVTNEQKTAKIAGTLLAMSIAVAVLAGVAILLGLVPTEQLAKGVAAVVLLCLGMAAMAAAAKNATKGIGNIIALTVAIGIMTAAVVVLSTLDTKKLAGATIAIGSLMAIFALMARFAGSANKSIGVLIVITAAVGMLGFILYKLAELSVESTIDSAIALGRLLLALTASVILLGNFSGSAIKALKGILALTAMAMPLVAFVGVLALMQNVQNAIANAAALGLLTVALSIALVPLTVVGEFARRARKGVLTLTAMAIPMVTFVGILALMENLENAIKNVIALTIMMNAATILLVALALIGPAALAGMPAIAGLMGVIIGIGALVVAIGYLTQKFPQLESFLDTGIPILEKLAHGIGSFVGNLVSGFADGLTDGLPEIGQHLTDFMDNARGFIDGAKTVDESVLTGAGVLAKSILALSNAELINGIASFLSGGVSFASMGTDLSNFITNVKPFLDGIKDVDPTSIEAVKTLAETISILTKAEILEGLTSLWTGGTSLADFGAELAAFGPSMKTYADSVAGIDGEAVKASAEAAKSLAEMTKSIPSKGGWKDTIFGDNSADMFGEQIEAFGKSLKSYSEAVAGIDCKAVKASAEAAKSLAEMTKSIPSKGGWKDTILGDDSADIFGEQIEAFGKSLKAYSEAVAGIDCEAVKASADAAKSLAEMTKSIPSKGGWKDTILGDDSADIFGEQIEAFGKSLKAYSETVTGLATEPIANSVKAARSIAQLAKALPTDGGFWSWLKNDAISMSDFGTQLSDLGAGMLSYSQQVDGINIVAVSASIFAADYLASFIKRLKGIDTSGVSTFKKALSSLGEASIDGFIKAFTVATEKLTSIGADVVTTLDNGIRSHIPLLNATSITLVDSMHRGILSRMGTFTSAGLMLMNGFVTGVMSQRARVSSMMVFSITSAVTVARGYYSSFYNAGSYLVSGFASGISANSYKAAAKARAMAKAAADAAEDELDINSPSKVFRKIGAEIPEGFAMGIDKLKGVVVRSATSMATASVDGVRDAISNIAALINSDIDAQPTIRPVVDLSNVRAGAGAISSMFGTPIAATATVGAINSMMNLRNQNGVNADVVSAIDKLRKDLSENSGGNTYSINGITYDDGSNVSDAIKTLIRAAKIERRV